MDSRAGSGLRGQRQMLLSRQTAGIWESRAGPAAPAQGAGGRSRTGSCAAPADAGIAGVRTARDDGFLAQLSLFPWCRERGPVP